MKDRAGAPPQGRPEQRRWIVCGTALLIAAMIASTAHDLWTSHHEAQRQAEEEIVVLARVLARASGHGEVLWKHERRTL